MTQPVYIDFDGVLNAYDGSFSSGPIDTPPVEGAFGFLDMLDSLGVPWTVYSARASGPGQVRRIAQWFLDNGRKGPVSITNVKGPASMYIDDRAWRFDGSNFPTKDEVLNFMPYWRRGAVAASDMPSLADMASTAFAACDRVRRGAMALADGDGKTEKRSPIPEFFPDPDKLAAALEKAKANQAGASKEPVAQKPPEQPANVNEGRISAQEVSEPELIKKARNWKFRKTDPDITRRSWEWLLRNANPETKKAILEAARIPDKSMEPPKEAIVKTETKDAPPTPPIITKPPVPEGPIDNALVEDAMSEALLQGAGRPGVPAEPSKEPSSQLSRQPSADAPAQSAEEGISDIVMANYLNSINKRLFDYTDPEKGVLSVALQNYDRYRRRDYLTPTEQDIMASLKADIPALQAVVDGLRKEYRFASNPENAGKVKEKLFQLQKFKRSAADSIRSIADERKRGERVGKDLQKIKAGVQFLRNMADNAPPGSFQRRDLESRIKSLEDGVLAKLPDYSPEGKYSDEAIAAVASALPDVAALEKSAKRYSSADMRAAQVKADLQNTLSGANGLSAAIELLGDTGQLSPAVRAVVDASGVTLDSVIAKAVERGEIGKEAASYFQQEYPKLHTASGKLIKPMALALYRDAQEASKVVDSQLPPGEAGSEAARRDMLAALMASPKEQWQQAAGTVKELAGNPELRADYVAAVEARRETERNAEMRTAEARKRASALKREETDALDKATGMSAVKDLTWKANSALERVKSAEAQLGQAQAANSLTPAGATPKAWRNERTRKRAAADEGRAKGELAQAQADYSGVREKLAGAVETVKAREHLFPGQKLGQDPAMEAARKLLPEGGAALEAAKSEAPESKSLDPATLSYMKKDNKLREGKGMRKIFITDPKLSDALRKGLDALDGQLPEGGKLSSLDRQAAQIEVANGKSPEDAVAYIKDARARAHGASDAQRKAELAENEAVAQKHAPASDGNRAAAAKFDALMDPETSDLNAKSRQAYSKVYEDRLKSYGVLDKEGLPSKSMPEQDVAQLRMQAAADAMARVRADDELVRGFNEAADEHIDRTKKPILAAHRRQALDAIRAGEAAGLKPSAILERYVTSRSPELDDALKADEAALASSQPRDVSTEGLAPGESDVSGSGAQRVSVTRGGEAQEPEPQSIEVRKPEPPPPAMENKGLGAPEEDDGIGLAASDLDKLDGSMRISALHKDMSRLARRKSKLLKDYDAAKSAGDATAARMALDDINDAIKGRQRLLGQALAKKVK